MEKKGSRRPMVRVRKKDSRRKGENFVIIKRQMGIWEEGILGKLVWTLEYITST